MRLNALGKTWNLAIRNNTGLLVANIILAVALAFSVGANLSTHERVVLIPPHMNEKMEVSWADASAPYYKSFGLYVATLIGNITPRNVQLVADSIGQHLDSSIYAPVRAQILALADDPVFQKSNSVNYFAPDQVVFEAERGKTQKVFVVGRLMSTSYAGAGTGAATVDAKNLVYEIGVRMDGGRPVITEFTSYPGAQAHTAKWRASQQQGQVQQQKEQQHAAEKANDTK